MGEGRIIEHRQELGAIHDPYRDRERESREKKPSGAFSHDEEEPKHSKGDEKRKALRERRQRRKPESSNDRPEEKPPEVGDLRKRPKQQRQRRDRDRFPEREIGDAGVEQPSQR